jgi:hypothetical protein
MAACAAFHKESRMKFANAIKLDRKSGALSSQSRCKQSVVSRGRTYFLLGGAVPVVGATWVTAGLWGKILW